MNVLVLVCVLSVAGMAVAVPRGQWTSRERQYAISDEEILATVAQQLPSMRSAIARTDGKPQDILNVIVGGVMSTVRSLLSLMGSKVENFDYRQQISQLGAANLLIPKIMESLSDITEDERDSPSRFDPADHTSHFDLPGYDRGK